jgi:hypothetical protein
VSDNNNEVMRDNVLLANLKHSLDNANRKRGLIISQQ